MKEIKRVPVFLKHSVDLCCSPKSPKIYKKNPILAFKVVQGHRIRR